MASGGGRKTCVAAATPGGEFIIADKGTTGIDRIAEELRRQMKSELAERIETVYADVYFYPLGLAILLLLAEVFVADAPRRLVVRRQAPQMLPPRVPLRQTRREVPRGSL